MRCIKIAIVLLIAITVGYVEAAVEYQNGMIWHYNYQRNPETQKENFDCRIGFLYTNQGKTHLILSLSEKLRNAIPVTPGCKLVYKDSYYHFASNPEILEQLERNHDELPDLNVDRLSYSTKQHPKRISVKDCLNLINGHATIFYTGAGISAAEVPDMTKLENLLEFSEASCEDHYCIDMSRKILADPEKYIRIADKFFKACENCKPTPAHLAIVKISKSPVLTENVDQLHQKTGIKVLFIPSMQTYSDELTRLLRDSDCIIAVGLSIDQSGLLKRYKELNSTGKIISFNINSAPQPYLSDEDYMVIGDVQTTIPELGRMYGN